jgi:hypothetical protein
MLNRRSFFKAIGKAVLGTAIALKIPDSIIPQTILPEPIKQNVVTFKQLNDLYNKCINEGNNPPRHIYVSSDMFNALPINRVKLKSGIHYSKGLGKRWLKFKDAHILPSYINNDNMVHAIGPTYDSSGRLYINENIYI